MLKRGWSHLNTRFSMADMDRLKLNAPRYTIAQLAWQFDVTEDEMLAVLRRNGIYASDSWKLGQ